MYVVHADIISLEAVKYEPHILWRKPRTWIMCLMGIKAIETSIQAIWHGVRFLVFFVFCCCCNNQSYSGQKLKSSYIDLFEISIL